jgi:hypothetical protein
MENQPKPDLVIPVGHLPVLINSAIAESMLQTERRLENGEFEWRWRDGEGSTETQEWTAWSRSPPLDFFSDEKIAVKLLSKFCAQNGLTAELQFVEGNWAGRIGRVTGEGQAQIVGRPALMSTMAQTICMMICSVIKVDLAARHRDLFPGHYLVLQ